VTGTSGAGAANLIVTNFSGGKRHLGPGGGAGDELVELARLIGGVDRTAGVVVAIQEMTTDDPGLPVRAAALERHLDRGARSSFVPRVSTAWYPLVEKWSSPVGPGQAHNEGLCVLTGDGGLVLLPWSTVDGPTGVASATRVLDLPTFEFPDPSGPPAAGGDWLSVVSNLDGVDRTISFRPTFYQGSRDTDPRVAQACLLGWADGSGPAAPVCVVVNVHLSTLRREKAPDPGVGRVYSAEATFLRDRQLGVIAQFVRTVETTLHLPVLIVGDFNAEPASSELRAFGEAAGVAPLLTHDMCWKCGTVQEKRPKVGVYETDHKGLALTLEPPTSREPRYMTDAVCSNDSCREPRFTHKGILQLVDNVFVTGYRSSAPWTLTPGPPRVDLGWGYSDHAAVIVPLTLTPTQPW
jgi:hypothetical protein